MSEDQITFIVVFTATLVFLCCFVLCNYPVESIEIDDTDPPNISMSVASSVSYQEDLEDV